MHKIMSLTNGNICSILSNVSTPRHFKWSGVRENTQTALTLNVRKTAVVFKEEIDMPGIVYTRRRV